MNWRDPKIILLLIRWDNTFTLPFFFLPIQGETLLDIILNYENNVYWVVAQTLFFFFVSRLTLTWYQFFFFFFFFWKKRNKHTGSHLILLKIKKFHLTFMNVIWCVCFLFLSCTKQMCQSLIKLYKWWVCATNHRCSSHLLSSAWK